MEEKLRFIEYLKLFILDLKKLSKVPLLILHYIFFLVWTGLIDGHTHPVWTGDRVHEFSMKVYTYFTINLKSKLI